MAKGQIFFMKNDGYATIIQAVHNVVQIIRINVVPLIRPLNSVL